MKTKISLLDQYKKSKSKNQIQIQLHDKVIDIDIFQLYKFSQFIQDEYPMQDIKDRFPQDILQFQHRENIKDENIIIFFNLIQEENCDITSDNYTDLLKLSDAFKVEALQDLLGNYQKDHLNDVDFIINSLINQRNALNSNDDISFIDNFSSRMEECLYNKIDNCIQNKNFGKLPIPTICRIITKSDTSKINSNLLYDFIIESLKDRFVLLKVLEIHNLSDAKFDDFCDKFIYNDSQTSKYDDYLPCCKQIIQKFIKEKKERNSKISELEKNNQIQLNQIEKLKQNNIDNSNKVIELERINKTLNERILNLEKSVNEKNDKITKLEQKNQKQIQGFEHKNSIKIDEFKKEKVIFDQKILELQSKINKLQFQLDEVHKENDELIKVSKTNKKQNKKINSNTTQDIDHNSQVSLEDLYKGKTINLRVNRDIICPLCKGKGCKEQRIPKKCPSCNGIPKVLHSECPKCHGLGEIIDEQDKCLKCSGNRVVNEVKTVKVEVEPGMEDGDEIVIKGLSNEFPNKKTGNIKVYLKMTKNDHFIRKHDNLLLIQTISLSESFCGTSFVVTHLDGRKLFISTPKNKMILPDCVKIIKGEGMPMRSDHFKKGDLFIRFCIVYPIPNQISSSFKQELVNCVPLKNGIEGIDLNDEIAYKYELDESNVDFEQFQNSKSNDHHSNEDDDKSDDEDIRCQPM